MENFDIVDPPVFARKLAPSPPMTREDGQTMGTPPPLPSVPQPTPPPPPPPPPQSDEQRTTMTKTMSQEQRPENGFYPPSPTVSTPSSSLLDSSTEPGRTNSTPLQDNDEQMEVDGTPVHSTPVSGKAAESRTGRRYKQSAKLKSSPPKTIKSSQEVNSLLCRTEARKRRHPHTAGWR